MILVALLIGAILVVAAIRGTQGTLFSALATDVPGYVVWAAAIIALGAIGFVPELKPISRGLLILVIIVIVMRNYQTIIAGFQSAISGASQTAPGASGAASASSASGSDVASPTPIAPAVSAPSLSVTAPPAPSAPSAPSPYGNLIDNLGVNFNEDTAPAGFGAAATAAGF